MEKDLNIKTLISQLKKDFTKIIKFNFVFSSLSLIYFLFFYPPTYLSSATLIHSGNDMKPSQTAGGFFNSIGISSSQFGGSTPEAEIIIQILNSDDFIRELLYKEFYYDKFDYKAPLFKILHDSDEIEGNLEEIFEAKKFFKNEVFSAQKNRLTNVITITVKTSNASISYNVAQEMISQLNRTYNTMDQSRAIEKISFINERINSENAELLKAEERFIDFKNKNKAIQSPQLILKEQRLQTELSLYTSVLTTLMQQLELAQLEEYDDVNEIYVLSNPELAPYRNNPRRSLFIMCVLFGGFLSFTNSLFNLIRNNEN